MVQDNAFCCLDLLNCACKPAQKEKVCQIFPEYSSSLKSESYRTCCIKCQSMRQRVFTPNFCRDIQLQQSLHKERLHCLVAESRSCLPSKCLKAHQSLRIEPGPAKTTQWMQSTTQNFKAATPVGAALSGGSTAVNYDSTAVNGGSTAVKYGSTAVKYDSTAGERCPSTAIKTY